MRIIIMACFYHCHYYQRQRALLLQLFRAVLLLQLLASPARCFGDSDADYYHYSRVFFRVDVVDDETGIGVPLVLLRTNNYLEYFSDSAGRVAFFEPGMMNTSVWFSVLADGYELNVRKTKGAYSYNAPYDSGFVVNTRVGAGPAIVYMTRKQHAERVYRLTGGGLYRDSVLTGAPIPETVADRALIDPLSGSTGQDTLHLVNLNATHVMYFFGDTVCPRSARQNNCNAKGMYTVAAVSDLGNDSRAEYQPSQPPRLKYIADSNHDAPHPIAPIAPLSQNTWIAGVFMGIDDGDAASGRDNYSSDVLFAAYFKNPGDGASPGQAKQGMAIWNASARQMEALGSPWPRNASLSLNGAHAVQVISPADAAKGFEAYAWFVNGYVTSRVLAKASAVARYERFEHLPMPAMPTVSCNTVNWNAWAKRYLCLGDNRIDDGGIFLFGGPVPITIAWSHDLLGPYVNATEIIAHNASGASCYNGLHMPHMDMEGGRVVHVACTYTAMWSNTDKDPNLWSSCLFGINSHQGCSPVVPRYEYNNIVSRIDLQNIIMF